MLFPIKSILFTLLLFLDGYGEALNLNNSDPGDHNFIFLNPLNLLNQYDGVDVYASSSAHPQVLNFIDQLVDKHNISRERLIRLFDRVDFKGQLQVRLSNQLRRPAEKVMHWEAYRDQFVNQERIAAGITFYKKHRNLIKKISQEFSVPPPIILATLGLESYYGKANYRYPVFHSLAINSFANNLRSKFYLQQLEYFLIWVHRNHFSDETILSLHGSYSGAIGPAQFIPFSIHHYGYDYNQDGKVDMLKNYQDVLASIANYYHKNGWKKNKKIVTRLKSPCPVSKNVLSFSDTQNRPLCWRKEHNFKVILTYNRNDYYAQALYLLALALDTEIKNSF